MVLPDSVRRERRGARSAPESSALTQQQNLSTPARRQAMIDKQLDTPEVDSPDGVANDIQMRVSAATARTRALLSSKGRTDLAALHEELEAWCLEGGRMETTVTDSLKDSAAELARYRQEATASRRALEMHISNAASQQRELQAREAEEAAERDDYTMRLEAELAQAKAELNGLAEQHGMKLREGQAEVNEAAAREVELFCQLEQERHNARLAVEAQKESEEALRQLQAMVKVLEEERGRDDDTRRTWAEERRKWAEGVEAVRVAAAQKHDELYATLQSCRRQLENAQLEAAKSEARAVAADDRAAAAEGAREVSDSVWQEKLAAAHAEAQLRGQELTARDEALRGHERERSLWKTGVAELEMRTAQLTEELQQRGEAARGLMAEAASLRLELVSRDAAVASQEDEMESLAEEVLTLKEERDRAVGELEATTTACMELEAEMLQGQREAASVHEQRFAEQEARWLAQAASWEQEMNELRHKVTASDARANDALQTLSTARSQGEEAASKLRAKLALSEQAGGARAAALTAEVERLRSSGVSALGMVGGGMMPSTRTPPPQRSPNAAAAALAITPKPAAPPPPTRPAPFGRQAAPASTLLAGRIDARATLASLLTDM